MTDQIDIGLPVFLVEGQDRVGMVRETRKSSFVMFIENSGEFEIPMTSVDRVHDGKVLLIASAIDTRVLNAIEHSRDAEDPKLVG